MGSSRRGHSQAALWRSGQKAAGTMNTPATDGMEAYLGGYTNEKSQGRAGSA